MKKFAWGLLGLLSLSGVAWADGFNTPGLPQVPVTVSPTYGQVIGNETIAADTNLASGANPQSVAVMPAQIAAIGACMGASTGTASSGAVTLSRQCGLITSESLSTAVAATYTLTITNTLVTATTPVQASAFLGSSTAGHVQVVSVTPAAGSVVIVVKNTGTAAISGTIFVPFFVVLP